MTSLPHTPEHNGIAERKHQHIVETGMSLLSHASIPRAYWPFALATAVYLINRMLSQPLHFETPFQTLHGRALNYEKLRIFGCLCFPWLRPYASHKLDTKSSPCVFLGYSITQSAYFCLDRATSRIYTSRHVVFHESVFPFATSTTAFSNNDSGESDNPVTTFPVVSLLQLQVAHQPWNQQLRKHRKHLHKRQHLPQQLLNLSLHLHPLMELSQEQPTQLQNLTYSPHRLLLHLINCPNRRCVEVLDNRNQHRNSISTRLYRLLHLKNPHICS